MGVKRMWWCSLRILLVVLLRHGQVLEVLLGWFSRAHGAGTGIERRWFARWARRAVRWAVKTVERSTVLRRHSTAVRSERAERVVGASGLVFAGGAGGKGNGQHDKADAAGAPGANADVLVSENALRLT